ncbi:S-layer homology domain-containing protein, partial [Anaerosphaera multitolerans]
VEAVEAAKANAINSINGVNPKTMEQEEEEKLNAAKVNANAEIDAAAKKKIDEINAMDNVSEDAKTNAINQVNEYATAGKKAVEAADTIAKVEEAKTTAIKNINGVTPKTMEQEEKEKLDAAKVNANAEIDAAANAKIKDIQGMTNVSKDAKTNAINQVKDYASAGKEAVNKAETVETVESEKTNVIKNINGVTSKTMEQEEEEKLNAAKVNANAEIDAAAKKKIDEINAMDNVSENAKTNAINQVKDYASAGKEAVNKAETVEAVDTEKTNAIKNINGVTTNIEEEGLKLIVKVEDELTEELINGAKIKLYKILETEEIPEVSQLEQEKSDIENEILEKEEKIEKLYLNTSDYSTPFEYKFNKIQSSKGVPEIFVEPQSLEDVFGEVQDSEDGPEVPEAQNAEEVLDAHIESQKFADEFGEFQGSEDGFSIVQPLEELEEEIRELTKRKSDIEIILAEERNRGDLNQKNELVGEFEIETNGTITINVDSGKYFIEEIQPPVGYELVEIDENPIEVQDESEVVTISNRKITSEETFMVTYYGNDNTSGEAPVDNNVYEVGEIIKVLDRETLWKDGFVFLGWSRDKDASTAEYKPGDTLEIIGNIDLYAVWEKESSSNGWWSWGNSSNEIKEKDKEILNENKGDTILHKAYLTGYPDNTIRASGNITRAEAAAILARLKVGEENIPDKSTINYTDVNNEDWYAKYIVFVTENEIMKGYEDGSFRPNGKISRAEFATVVARYNTLVSMDSTFEDVKGHWAEKYIGTVANKGWITGYPDGTFGPKNNITREEVVTIINKMLERKVDEEGLNNLEIKTFTDLNSNRWSYYDLIEASISHETIMNGLNEKWIKVID